MSKLRIKKTLATFGDQKAVIYGEFLHKNDMEANYHIEDLGEGNDGGRYMLTIENQGWMDDDLAKLEGILFNWMDEANGGFSEEDFEVVK